MEVTEEALQDAGLTRDTLPKNTGVYIGVGILDIPTLLIENRAYNNAHTLPGLAHTVSPNRISYNYGLTGPSVVVDTACAASLTAIHVGCMALWNRECEVAIAGATSNLYSPETTVAFSHLGVLSSTGNSAPFDVTNNGYVRGEGTGIVIMKPLAEAIKNNDHVYCVVRGTTSAHNGYSMSLTLPSIDAQEELIRRCYKECKVPLEKVKFVEAHGTGTPVGDPIETAALGNTFGKARKEPLRVSSTKSSFGHLEVAAGMVQVIKAALMLEKRKYYKQIKWTVPNSRIDVKSVNMVIQTKEEPYVEKDNFLVGINTFGFGGSLVHMVFEEYKQKPNVLTEEQKAGWRFGEKGQPGRKIAVVFSAKTKQALINTAQKWMQFENEADAQMAVAWQTTRRAHFDERVVILANSSEEFRSNMLDLITNKRNVDVIAKTGCKIPSIAFVFSGYGQQWDDMGRCLYNNDPYFKETVDECDALFRKVIGWSALERYKIFIPEGRNKMVEGQIHHEACKPAILFLQIGINRLLNHWGIKTDIVMGVGVGELSAAVAANAITLEEAMKCIKIRMGAPPEETFIAEMNTVMNGPKARNLSFYSTITGKIYKGTFDANYWWKNISSELKIEEAVQSVLAANSSTYFIEIAGSPTLLPTVNKVLKDSQSDGLAVCCGEKDKNDWHLTTRAMAQVYCAGHKINWENVTRNAASYVSLPLYAWDHQVIRLETLEYFGRRHGFIDTSYLMQNGVVNMEKHAYLTDYKFEDEIIFPTAAYIEYMIEHDQSHLACLENIDIKENIVVSPFTPDGFVVDTKLTSKKSQSKLEIFSEEGKLHAEASIYCSDVNDKPVMNICQIEERCKINLDVNLIYSDFDKNGMKYGREFRVLHKIRAGNGEALGWTNGSYSTLKHERVNTTFLDCAFQVAIAAFSGGPVFYAPRKIGMLQMFVPKINPYQKAVIHAILTGRNCNEITTDISIADLNGKVLIQIAGFVAENMTSKKSNVDMTNCLFTSRWQPFDSALPSTQILTTSTSELEKMAKLYSSEANQILGIAAKFCEDSLEGLSSKKLDNDEEKIIQRNIKQFSDKTNGVNKIQYQEELHNLSELSIELKTLKAKHFSSILLGESGKTVITMDDIADVLNQSHVLKTYYSHIAYTVKAGVVEALASKQMVRVGQLGDPSTSLTRSVICELKDFIDEGRVQFVYLDSSETHFQSVRKDLTDLPEIYFDVVDVNTSKPQYPASAGSFDIFLSFDPLGLNQNYIPSLADCICSGGWLILLQIVKDMELMKLLLGGLGPHNISPVNRWGEKLRHAGFSAIRSLHPKPMPYALIMGCKSIRNTCDSSRWLIVSNRQNISDKMVNILSGSSRSCSVVEFLTIPHIYLGEVDVSKENKLNLMIMWDVNMDLSTIVQICEIVQSKYSAFVNIWFISRSSSCDVNCMASVGFLKSLMTGAEVQIHIVSIDEEDDEDFMSGIIEVTRSSKPGELEMRFHDKKLHVPRITRIVNNMGAISPPISTSPSPALKMDEVQVIVRHAAMYHGARGCMCIYAGEVEEVGTAVTNIFSGDRVMASGHVESYTRHRVSQKNVHKKPAQYTYQQAADTLLSTTMARHILIEMTNIKRGENVLVYPGESLLGKSVISVARQEGADVICLANEDVSRRSTDGAMGLVLVVDCDDPYLTKHLLQATHNRGVDIIVHTAEGEMPAACLMALSCGGRVYSSCHNTLKTEISATIMPLSTQWDMTLLDKEVGKAVHHMTYSNIKPIVGVNEKKIDQRSYSDGNKCYYGEYVSIDYEKISLSGVVDSKSLFSPSGTYLVTGGYGRLGKEICRWLVKEGAKHIAIVSRKGPQSYYDTLSKRAMEKSGVKVYDSTADISNITQVDHVFHCLSSDRTIPPVLGVFHAAGDMRNLHNWNCETAREMLKVQSVGAQNLHVVTTKRNVKLDCFVMFSSSSGICGNPALVCIGIACSYMDHLAENRRALGLPAISLQLGLIRGAGAIWETPELYEDILKSGLKSLHIDEVMAILSDLLHQDNVPSTVAIMDQVALTFSV